MRHGSPLPTHIRASLRTQLLQSPMVFDQPLVPGSGASVKHHAVPAAIRVPELRFAAGTCGEIRPHDAPVVAAAHTEVADTSKTPVRHRAGRCQYGAKFQRNIQP